ncbi:MAG: class I SAM-dependent methyltransferase [Ktedonobacterales bacterium]
MAKLGDIMRDKAQVRDNLYADPAKLGARVDLQRRFSVNPQPIADWELGLVDLSSVQQALDAGCGTGAFLLPLARRLTPQGASVIGLDLAEGTLGQARARVQAESLPVDCIIGDVEALPFADSSFDLVLANYMLYHVPNLDQAIAELGRVLRPGGTLLAATNGQGHMRELWQMEKQAFIHAGVSPQTVAAFMEQGRATRALSFRLENGAQWLRRSFTDVRLERYPDELGVTEVEPLVAYLVSLWSLDEMVEGVAATAQEQALLHTGVVDSFRALVQERIAADGVVRIAKDTGAFVAR